LPTKDHFSSSWTFVVEGGKAHQLVVELAGVAAGEQAEAADGVLADADQARGLSDATAVGEVGQDGQELGAGEASAEQGRALALGEAVSAGLTVEEPVLVGLAVAHANGEVAGAAPAVVRAVGVEAAEAAEVVQRVSPGKEPRMGSERLDDRDRRTIQHYGDTTRIWP
jgi:hypothetical protein